MIARRAFVSGRVQGVFYRATAVRKATSLALQGFARNLSDGRVEVLAIGPEAAGLRQRRERGRLHFRLTSAAARDSRPRSSAPFQRVHRATTLSEYQRLPVLPL
jgi:acylphosphatase